MIKKIFYYLIFISIAAGIAYGCYIYWQHEKNYPNTDDAYIQAHVINVAPRISGMVSKLYISDHQQVKAGQPLFDIDNEVFTIALQKAKADLDQTKQQVNAAESAVKAAESVLNQRKAELTNVRKNTARIVALAKKRVASVSQRDKAMSDLEVAKSAVSASESQLKEAQQKLGQLGGDNASIRVAQAAIANAELNLRYTHVVAPANGHIVNLNLRVGDQVNAYQQVFAIIESAHWWATANFKETELERIRMNQPAIIKVDMYPHHIFKGIITSISSGSGSSFALLPPENATGNWVKVTQRFPVRIDIINPDPKFPLRMGSSCEVTINTL